ncbi:MAG: ABC transporter ATP-binding protein, partial [Chloroflexota bacterium]
MTDNQTGPNPDEVIRIRDVTKVYTIGDMEVHALRGADLVIRRGEMVAIMGPSGSGKSTLMNIIGCLDTPTAGTYELDGIDVSALSDDELAAIRNKKIGFVFQSFNLLARTSALANVMLPLVYGRTDDRKGKAMRALERVGLGDRIDHRPNELSGGQQQRVAIARAIVNTPAIILADEPTGALDSRTSEEIMAIFQSLNQEEGIIVIFVTHEREIAEHTRRILHIKDGVVQREEHWDEPLSAAER